MTLSLAVLGDSIAYGQGASAQADTLGARLAADLAAAGMPVQVRVFAAPGAVSAALAGQAQRAAAWSPDLALVVVGANDLIRFVEPRQAAAQLGAAVRTLRTAGAEVVVAPAPDLSVVPMVPVAMRPTVRAGCRTLQQLQTAAATDAGARVADVTGSSATAFGSDPGLFSADRFHPSSAGYAVIAGALAPAVRAAARSAQRRRSG